MTSYETNEYKPTRRKSKFVSFVLMVVGVVLVVIGGSNILSSFSSLSDLSSMESFQPGEFLGGFFIGGIALVFGFAMFVFGVLLSFTANARPIFRASGFSKGMKENGFGFDGLGSSERVVIKLKCRNCGYLETEDADFCSKCRQRM